MSDLRYSDSPHHPGRPLDLFLPEVPAAISSPSYRSILSGSRQTRSIIDNSSLPHRVVSHVVKQSIWNLLLSEFSYAQSSIVTFLFPDPEAAVQPARIRKHLPGGVARGFSPSLLLA